MVVQTRDRDSKKSGEALEQLCGIYWRPLYIFARGKGLASSDAEDLTQDFIANFVRRGDFEKAKPQGGRLRSFLLTSFRRFMISDWRRRNSQRRGGGITEVPLDYVEAEDDFGHLLSSGRAPETIYDRVWAVTVVDAAMSAVETKYEAAGKKKLFDEIRPGITSSTALPPYDQLALKLNMTIANVKTTIHRIRHDFADCLRETVGDTLSPEENVEEEIRELLGILSSTG